MKKILKIILITFCSLSTIYGQEVTIPDSEFVKFLTSRYPSCMNGNKMNTQCDDVLNVTRLDIFPFQYDISDFTGLEYFINVEILGISLYTSYNLSELPPNLKNLKLGSSTGYGNGLDKLPEFLPSTLESIVISDVSEEFQLPELPLNLTTLQITDCPKVNVLNGISQPLPSITSSVTILTFNNVNRSSFDLSSSNVKELDLSNNNLSSLPVLPNSIQSLNALNNNLTSLPDLPNTIQTINVSNNNLSSLPVLPNTIKIINVSNNNLSYFPVLDSLISFAVNQNNLTTLTIPQFVTNAYFEHNSISNLTILSNVLNKVYASHNLLDSFVYYPNTIQMLDASYNNLTHFEIKSNMRTVYLDSNKIEHLSDVPEGLNILSIKNNSLNSLPLLPNSLCRLHASGNNITCFKNIPSGDDPYACGTKVPGLESDIPQVLCTITNVDNPDLSTSKISSFYDNDGLHISNPGYEYMEVKIYNINGSNYLKLDSYSNIEISKSKLQVGLNLVRINDNYVFKFINCK